MSKHESTTPDSTVAVHRATAKYRIYPTPKQILFLEGELKDACSLYNAAIEERIGAWRICRKSISYYDQQNQLPAMRTDGCLLLSSAQCAQDVLRRVDKAFKSFFARCKSDERPGFPRFKSYRRYDSITFPQYGNGCRILDTGKLRIQGSGHVKIKLHRPMEEKVKTLTIKREAGRWVACFVFENQKTPLTISKEEVGIDVGLTSFATLSDGSEIANQRFYRNAQARLRRCQRKVARRKKGSNRRRKAVLLLKRAHAHVVNQRTDFHHKESRKIVNKFGLIAVEDLNVKGLAGSMLAKSVNDAGWGQFLKFIQYKAEWAGREFIQVDPRSTSQTCICGEYVPKGLKDRWHNCPACGLSAGRDHVSAQVILQRAGNRPSSANVGAVMPCVGRESVCVYKMDVHREVRQEHGQ